jgi:Domain of unknown function (DUF6966)
MGPKTEALVKELKDTISVLDEANEEHWKAWMQESLGLILESDFRGVEKLLSGYGGMGSFNDLILGGHVGLLGYVKHSKKDIELNERLSIHREEMRALADELKREVQKDN